VRRRHDGRVNLVSEGYGAASFGLDDDLDRMTRWARYVAGMVRLLREGGIDVPGFDGELATDIPVGASLSSSAALEVVTGFAVSALAGVEPDPRYIALLGQRVENEVIGIQSGIMDQLISATATAGSATLIDCRTLETTSVAVPGKVKVVIMDTMTRRELADSEYGKRRAACERVAEALGVSKLRDADRKQIEALEVGNDRARALHVVTENDRVLRAADALQRGDVDDFGALMNESHRSLAEDYEVSSPELDLIVEIARDHDACLGARMTGGGFGGCAVALIARNAEEDFVERTQTTYGAVYGRTPDVWPVEPAAGASLRAPS